MQSNSDEVKEYMQIFQPEIMKAATDQTPHLRTSSDWLKIIWIHNLHSEWVKIMGGGKEFVS